MRVSREQVAENRRRILEAAGRLFRERGFGAVTVAEVMKAAGLTHGGFYGYFGSKDELIAAALEDLVVAPVPKPVTLEAYADRYLTPEHMADCAGGCPVAALGTDAGRQSPQARAAMTEGLRLQIARLGEGAGGERNATARQAAIGSWAAMVGAMILARMSDDPALAQQVLQETRAFIGQRVGDEPGEI
ncbi:TetR/AcrR family transcriptional regulator [Methylobacterium gnaphalii]|uniref:TetR family transcriptional regulator n=1 Tax=Methylobacterium gnaphalii TaxID=1010610 RepID=A0A512JNP0_9HYPH|nr:TetR/AcrR family transcriptional regulator [Methylobacterium gnaphalii]GEP11552.1 TetR family transcriptional regulator [Methylobacterium gnaphalii]GJD70294.1 HTH-type transcriptional regulator BetI [Methylobacterium gnaphalii]GLS48799.1 TetR family transcriptional regulator [Methylobacterium gnaphalii]